MGFIPHADTIALQNIHLSTLFSFGNRNGLAVPAALDADFLWSII
ncbi:hypothetical protein C725_1517 [Pacificimonas flava]|uniref:Uncharacterized protein n=1 Tax=Pacificimonas flava TaxID=1234595 RepID=M2T8U5_9SPHN|nr:hypothetical protein C725_1517 [Pacificimonas flava]